MYSSGSGSCVQERLAELREQLKPATHVWNKHARPAHLCGWKPNKTEDEPDVWFEPAKSLLMAVRRGQRARHAADVVDVTLRSFLKSEVGKRVTIQRCYPLP